MVATNVPVVIFAPGDETKTPLALTALNGLPLENPIIVNDRGFGSAFIADLDQVAWEGGGLTGLMASYRGLKDDAETAARAAVVARAAAEEAARNTVAPTAEVVAEALTSEGPAREAVNAAINAGTANLALKPDSGARAVGKGELIINARDYGAKGDGVTDDTAALQEWLTAGGSTLMDGTYCVSSTLVLAGTQRELTTVNATLVGTAPRMTILNVTGNGSTIRVNMDGRNTASRGIKVTGAGCRITGCLIENLHDSQMTARAIEVETSGGVQIDHNVIRNIHAKKPAGITGDFINSRAITLVSTTPATKPSVIHDNNIDGITGEEGDGIHVLFSGGGILGNAMTSILRNTINNAMRRCIKVQASGVEVAGNRMLYTSTTPPENPAAAIDVIQGSNVSVVNNEVISREGGGAISVTGIAGSLLDGIVVQGNRTNFRDDQPAGHIYAVYTRNGVVSNNTARGGTFAVAGGANESLIVDGNAHYGGNNNEISFRFVASSIGTVVTNNKNMNPLRATYLRNDGTGTHSSANYTKYVA